MRLKNILISLFALSAIHGSSQDNDLLKFHRHEIKLNIFNAVLESASLEYEYIISPDFTIGIGASYFFDISASEFDFIAFPNARFYPGNKEAATGFFTEFSIPFYAREGSVYNSATKRFEDKFVWGLGVGVAAGYKLISKNGFVTELFLGAGRNFNDDLNVELFSRFGVTFGKRF